MQKRKIEHQQERKTEHALLDLIRTQLNLDRLGVIRKMFQSVLGTFLLNGSFRKGFVTQFFKFQDIYRKLLKLILQEIVG